MIDGTGSETILEGEHCLKVALSWTLNLSFLRPWLMLRVMATDPPSPTFVTTNFYTTRDDAWCGRRHSASECVSDAGKAQCHELGGQCHTERDGY